MGGVMGPFQQVPLVAWCLLVSLPLFGIVVRHRRTISGPSRIKAPDRYTSEPSGIKLPIREVNDSLDEPDQQSGIPKMQIVFFHGIPSEDFPNVHLTTWYHCDGFLWPQAWLPEKIPGIHVFFVKYNACLENENFHMNNIGENLLSNLLQAKIGVSGCPVVLVGHCIGGLVIKKLCLKAHEELHSTRTSGNDRAKMLATFLENIKGIFYYSTPHTGIRGIAKASRVLRSPLFKFCETLSTETALLNTNFDKLHKRHSTWIIQGVGESLPVRLGVFKNTRVVEEASARMGIENFYTSIEDHFSICKPKEQTSGGFYLLTGLLHKIIDEEIRLQEERLQEELRLQEESRPENTQHLPKCLVGMETALQEIKSRLESDATLGLTGMGGLGKTTLVKRLFNELGSNFECSCFVHDVKSISGSVETLKSEVWSNMYMHGKKVWDKEDWSKLRGKHVLLVVDNVSKDRDVKLLLEIADCFSKESRFIATSRERDVFNVLDSDVYEVPFLDQSSAQQLFMSYAFKDKEMPPPKLASIITKIVQKCEGLPLTLEVLGQYLKKTRNEEDWKQTLDALDEVDHVGNFNERLWSILMLSVVGLEENEKQMFLDATTFFDSKSWTLQEALAAWRGAYGVKERLQWRELVNRSLVYDVTELESIKVHEQLRSLGRKIASESNDRSMERVFNTSTALRLLESTNELEKKDIHALRLVREQTDAKEIQALQTITLEENSEQVILGDGKIHIANLALEKLQNLKYLDVNRDFVIDGAEEASWFPRNLVVLNCVGFKTLDLAHQTRLVVLKISGDKVDSGDKVESLASSIGQLSALRIFTLSEAILTSIPDEIGNLSNLEILKIHACPFLETLPETLGQLSKLKILKLLDCFCLKTLPRSFQELSALENLEFFACGFETLPESLRQLSSLTHLRITDCENLEFLPASFGRLPALVKLQFCGCERLRSLPRTFGHLSALKYLEFYDCGVETLPDSLGQLSALNYLLISGCSNIESLPESFGHLPALVELTIRYCESLKSLPNSFGHLSALSRLEFVECGRLQSLPKTFGNLPVLRHLKFIGCDTLHSLPASLSQLAKLEYLEIRRLKEMKRLPDSLAELGALRHLTITELLSLKSIPDYIRNLPSLHTLELGVLPHVEKLPAWLGETGLKCLALSRKVFRIKNIHFSLSLDENAIEPIDVVNKIHSIAMDKVGTSRKRESVRWQHFTVPADGYRKHNLTENFGHKPLVLPAIRSPDYEGALAEMEVRSLGIPKLDGFLLQEKGIIKRILKDYHGALEDLTAALECFAKVDDGKHYSYDCWKHRGYVKSLMGDMKGAEKDGKMALELQRVYRGSLLVPHQVSHDRGNVSLGNVFLGKESREHLRFGLGPPVDHGNVSLGEEFVRYMHFELEGWHEMVRHERLMSSSHSEAMRKVKASDFQGALARFDAMNIRLLPMNREFFLQERGILKRLAGDNSGALEDLTEALEIGGEDFEVLKHRGYVKYLLGDLDGARLDAERYLRARHYPSDTEHLGHTSVAFLEYDLK